MSKNKHMRSEDSVVVVGARIPTTGPVSLVQGVYGRRGNLELIACDAVDGLWVFWFNADLDTDPVDTPDVPPGSWSAGLHFAAGRRYVDAWIGQSVLGPDHLEVLALTVDGVLQSWYWSAEAGFQRRPVDAAGTVAAFAAAHDSGTVRVTTTDAAGSVRHLVSSPRGYPARTWAPAADGPALGDDAAAELAAAGVREETVVPGTARRTASRRGAHGTTELTWRGVDGGIRHLGVPLG